MSEILSERIEVLNRFTLNTFRRSIKTRSKQCGHNYQQRKLLYGFE